MTTTEQLAQALRDIAEHRMSMYGNDDFFHLKKIARAALAAHEAEKAQFVFDPAAANEAALVAPVAVPQGEPVAARYDFDGYGYQYIDNGHGSDWQTRIPDAEMLYTKSDEAEIRADERERCARLCEFEASNCSSPKLGKLLTNDGRQIKKAQGVGALNCANAIRSMGKERGQG